MDGEYGVLVKIWKPVTTLWDMSFRTVISYPMRGQRVMIN